MEATLTETLPRLRDFFESFHFQFICDAFVTSFVDRGVIPSLYKCKRVSEYGAQQLSLDFAGFKATILEISGDPPAPRYVKLVTKEIGKIEAILKLLFVPNDGVVDAYRALMPNGTVEELERVLKMKGTKREEKNELLGIFRASISPSPLSPLSTLSLSPASPLSPELATSPSSLLSSPLSSSPTSPITSPAPENNSVSPSPLSSSPTHVSPIIKSVSLRKLSDILLKK